MAGSSTVQEFASTEPSDDLLEVDAHADSQDDSPEGMRPFESAGMARKRPKISTGNAQSAATAAYRAAREWAPDLARSLAAPAQALTALSQQTGPAASRKTREKAAQPAGMLRVVS